MPSTQHGRKRGVLRPVQGSRFHAALLDSTPLGVAITTPDCRGGTATRRPARGEA
jgi:hypothetical protein